ncbi:MAG: hypothetical protein ACE14U_00855 [Candidatus Velamenicoccus archaeovorus]
MDIATVTLSFVPLLVILGVRTSYSDLRKGIVKNWDLVFTLFAATALYGYLIVYHGVQIDPVLFIGNFCIAASFGLILYFTDCWGAGDAKLFIVYSLMVPFPADRAVLPFSAFVIFANTIMIACGAVILLSLKDVIRSFPQCLQRLFSLKTLKRLMISFSLLLSISWVVPYLLGFFGAHASPLIFILLTYLLYSGLHSILRFFKSYALFSVVVLCGIGIRFWLFPHPLEVLSSLFLSFRKVILVTFFFGLLDIFFQADEVEKKKTNDDSIILAPHMFLGVMLTQTHFLKGVMKLMNYIWR